jgi:hypothetical protein
VTAWPHREGPEACIVVVGVFMFNTIFETPDVQM